jgi:hypothetical protein
MFIPNPKFRLGQVVATPGALEALEEAGQTVNDFLDRHAQGDWGGLSDEDWQANEYALQEGLRLLSAYTTATGEKIWIITEWDRSYTTLLLPSEY